MATVNLNGINYDDLYWGYTDLDFVALGGVYMTPAHSFGAGYRLGMIGPQWVMVDPLGKVFIYRGVFGVDRALHNTTLGGAGQAGRNSSTTVLNKFSSNLVNYGASIKTKLTRSHFSAIGPFSANITNTGMPDLFHKSPSRDARRKDRAASFWGLTDPVKDLSRLLPGSPPGNSDLFYRPTGDSNVGWPDCFDPKWTQIINIEFGPSRFSSFSTRIGFSFEESDYVSRWLADGHPNERSGALNGGFFDTYMNLHLGMAVLWTQPIVTTAQDTIGATVTFTDTVNYSKARLIQNLKDKYGTIGALNSAWQTGGYYTTFDQDLAGGGWGAGRGVADEDGLRPRPWFGQFSPAHKGHPANTNNIVDSTSWGGAWTAPGVGAPNLTNAVKIDLDQFYAQAVVAWIKPVWDNIRAIDPGMIFSPINNWGFPRRPALAPVWNQYCDLFLGGSLLNYRAGLTNEQTIQEATDDMNWVYGQVPKPHIANYYSAPDRRDSCLYYFSGTSAVTGGNLSAGQRINTYLRTVTMNFQTTAGHYPHVGWMKWEYYDNPAEQLHWGLSSLNDNLYDGRDYTTSQADPWFPSVSVATEDFAYSDMLGWGGTTVLQRTDLIVGGNIQIKALVEAQLGTPTGNVVMTASPGAFSLVGQPVTTTADVPNLLSALPGVFTVTGSPVTTTVGDAENAFLDNFNRADSTDLGANWTEVGGNLRIITNVVFPQSAAVICRARRTADRGSDNHYAQMKVNANTIPVGNAAGYWLLARGNGTDLTAYGLQLIRGTGAGAYTINLIRSNAAGSVYTDLTTAASISFTSPSTLRLEVSGSQITALINGVIVAQTTDTVITTGLRTGFANKSGTNSTSDFTGDDFQEGNLAALTNTILTVETGAFVLSGQAVGTSVFDNRLVVGTGDFVLTGQDVATTLPAQGMTAEAGAFTVIGRDVATIVDTATTGNVPMIRVFHFVPGRIAVVVLRALVPESQRFFYADPNLVSVHPVMTADERIALRNGAIVEKKQSIQAPLTFLELQILAREAQLAFQQEIDHSNVLGMSGLYGAATKYTTVWT